MGGANLSCRFLPLLWHRTTVAERLSIINLSKTLAAAMHLHVHMLRLWLLPHAELLRLWRLLLLLLLLC